MSRKKTSFLKQKKDSFGKFDYFPSTRSHAEKCPVCHGKGVIREIFGQGYVTSRKTKTCHACGGKGWVTVRD